MIFYILITTAICLANDSPLWAWFLVSVALPTLAMCAIECLANWQD